VHVPQGRHAQGGLRRVLRVVDTYGDKRGSGGVVYVQMWMGGEYRGRVCVCVVTEQIVSFCFIAKLLVGLV
jgi:hypothetical protein